MNVKWGEAEGLGALGHPQENRTPNLNSRAQRDSTGTTCSAAVQLPGADTRQGTEQGSGGDRLGAYKDTRPRASTTSTHALHMLFNCSGLSS